MTEKYPHDLLYKLAAFHINTQVENGCHWYIFNAKHQPEQLNYLTTLKQQIINLGGLVKNVLEITELENDYRLVVINLDIVKELSAEYMENCFKEFPQLRHKIKDLHEIRQKEIELLVKYIQTKTVNTFDILLYKCKGDRKSSCYIHSVDKNTKQEVALYKKEMYGFYLTEEDLKDVNGELAKINKKISVITKFELYNRNNGIRYTLEITEADFV